MLPFFPPAIDILLCLQATVAHTPVLVLSLRRLQLPFVDCIAAIGLGLL
jgi:hypothetical protein